jgi:hypothetical protein
VNAPGSTGLTLRLENNFLSVFIKIKLVKGIHRMPDSDPVKTADEPAGLVLGVAPLSAGVFLKILKKRPYHYFLFIDYNDIRFFKKIVSIQ